MSEFQHLRSGVGSRPVFSPNPFLWVVGYQAGLNLNTGSGWRIGWRNGNGGGSGDERESKNDVRKKSG